MGGPLHLAVGQGPRGVVSPLLAAVPFLRTHYLGLLTRIEERDGI